MKTTYIPTEEELIELGFKPETASRHANLDVGTCGRIYYSSYDKYFFTNIGNIYPRSKQALIEFISNFSPND